MKDISQLVEELALFDTIRLEDLPGVDLYMDQVIQLFENQFGQTKRNEDEKVLTKTMINNYAKGKLFFPVQKKKYTKEHLILISLIYQLKGALSIGDIKLAMDPVNEKAVAGEMDLGEFYSAYLGLAGRNTENFISEMVKLASDAKEAADGLGNDQPEMEQLLLIASLAHISNMYRRAAERLVDDFGQSGKK